MRRRGIAAAFLAAMVLYACADASSLSPADRAPVPPPPRPLSLEETATDSSALAASQSSTLLTELEHDPSKLENKVIAFPTSFRPDAGLASYEASPSEVTLFPGAGRGVKAPTYLAPGRYYFTQDFAVQVYDRPREQKVTLFDPRLVGGFVLFALPDLLGTSYCLATGDRRSALNGLGLLYRLPCRLPSRLRPLVDASASELLFFPWDPVPVPEEVTPVNAVAVRHGLIQSFFITAISGLVVFATADGDLFLYSESDGTVQELRTNREIEEGQAAFVTMETVQGRWIAWEDRVLKRVFMLDRFTGRIDPLAVPNIVLKPLRRQAVAIIPTFIGVDPFHLYLIALLPDGRYAAFAYDLRDETCLALVPVNRTTLASR